MNKSATTIFSKGEQLVKLPDAEFTYVCARNQHQAHNLLLSQVKKSGLSQKQIAQMTGINEATLSRLLRRPRNMELNTLSKIIYAVCGAALSISLSLPNSRSSWVIQDYHPKNRAATIKTQTLEPKVEKIMSTTDQKVLGLANA